MSWLKETIWLYFLIGILSVLLSIQLYQNYTLLQKNPNSVDSTVLLIGKKISASDYPTLEGKSVNLAQLQGNYKLLIFFDTNCVYCQKDIPLWHTIIENTHHHQIDVLGVTSEENYSDVSAYILDNNLPIPIILDKQKQLFSEMNVASTPTKVLLSNDLRILQIWHGWTTNQSSASSLGMMLALLGVEPTSLPKLSDFTNNSTPLD